MALKFSAHCKRQATFLNKFNIHTPTYAAFGIREGPLKYSNIWVAIYFIFFSFGFIMRFKKGYKLRYLFLFLCVHLSVSLPQFLSNLVSYYFCVKRTFRHFEGFSFIYFLKRRVSFVVSKLDDNLYNEVKGFYFWIAFEWGMISYYCL